MGYSKTPKYRIEIDEQSPNIGLERTHQMAWEGRATSKRLEEYVMMYAKSLEHGGVNYHISKDLGYIPYPVRARIVEQKTRKIVAQWQAAAFQVFHINP